MCGGNKVRNSHLPSICFKTHPKQTNRAKNDWAQPRFRQTQPRIVSNNIRADRFRMKQTISSVFSFVLFLLLFFSLTPFPPSHRVCLLVSWMASTRWPGMIITTPCCCNQHIPIPIILIYSHSWCYCNCRITTIPPLGQIHQSHTLLDCCCQIISILINIPSGTLCSWIISLHIVKLVDGLMSP